jgi:hypothetical protein
MGKILGGVFAHGKRGLKVIIHIIYPISSSWPGDGEVLQSHGTAPKITYLL